MVLRHLTTNTKGKTMVKQILAAIEKKVTVIKDKPGWVNVLESARDGDKYFEVSYERPNDWESFTKHLGSITDPNVREKNMGHWIYGLDLAERAASKPAAAVETTIITKRSDGTSLDLMSLSMPVLCKVINGAMVQGVIGKKPHGAIIYTRKVLLEQHKVTEKDGEVVPVVNGPVTPAATAKK